MRYFILMLLGICFTSTVQGQIYEVGVFAGGSNFIGDVGSTTYIAPNKLALGGIFKWNRSKRHSWRGSVIYSNLEGNDYKSSDPRRKARNYTFTNNLLEFSFGLEYTFLDFDLESPDRQTTPYLYTGISMARHRNYYFDNGLYTYEKTHSWAYGIPMTVGIKTTLSSRFILAFEVGARYTFSDQLDGSVPDLAPKELYQFGNTKSNDWYVFTGVTLTYTFGQKPCYCIN